ncbi:MAG: TolC family protein [Bacteroidaceae bacterium]|nr:TolC family protein [Bacteroidaceae bacterium]
MKKLYNLVFVVMVSAVLLTSCSAMKEVEKDYQNARNPQLPSDIIGAEKLITGVNTSSNLGDVSWRVLFNDPCFHAIVDSALANNLDMEICRKRIQEAELSLSVAKKAFFPSVTISPNGTISNFNSKTTKLYDMPLTVQWQADIFGSLRNAKKSQKALLEKSHDVIQTVQCQLISNLASLYYQLLMLDKEDAIMEQTEILWAKSVETQKALMQAGVATRAAVDRMSASYYSIKSQIIDTKKEIVVLENAICRFLGEAPHHITRGSFDNFVMPSQIGVGIPMQVLQNRPDVRAAQKTIESAFYDTKTAFADMFPKLTLGGSIGWSNGSDGSVNPGLLLSNALASLTAPLFAQGKLNANFKLSKIEMDIAQKELVQTIINAGNDVNNALIECEASNGKGVFLKKESESLKAAYDATEELMNRGKATYLEVLTAQESLLSAQLTEVTNDYAKINALINLYIALGGGR